MICTFYIDIGAVVLQGYTHGVYGWFSNDPIPESSGDITKTRTFTDFEPQLLNLDTKTDVSH